MEYADCIHYHAVGLIPCALIGNNCISSFRKIDAVHECQVLGLLKIRGPWENCFRPPLHPAGLRSLQAPLGHVLAKDEGQ